MKINFFTLFLLISTIILFAFKIADDQTTVYIIGDSTAANKSAKAYPETGWGMKFQEFFNGDVVIDNRALNGRSTKSFINEKRWQPVYELLKAGDYVLIEFGHNDEKVDKPTVGASIPEFKANLIKYITETREKNAFPVLLTPIARRNFKDGVLIDTHGEYPKATRQIADSLKVPLIDMTVKTDKLLKKLGELPSIKLFNHVDSGNVNYPKGVKDNTHLSPEGAKQVAGLVVKGIKELKLPLAKKLK